MNDHSRKDAAMKAIVISAYGPPQVLTITDLPDPVPAAGEVMIRVRAFGLNHAEAYMRSGAWGQVAQVPGIECAGTVEADPSGRLAAGTPVVAILGGVGRAAPEPGPAAWADGAGPRRHLLAWPGRSERRGRGGRHRDRDHPQASP